jgi:hypothetical protein
MFHRNARYLDHSVCAAPITACRWPSVDYRLTPPRLDHASILAILAK